MEKIYSKIYKLEFKISNRCECCWPPRKNFIQLKLSHNLTIPSSFRNDFSNFPRRIVPWNVSKKISIDSIFLDLFLHDTEGIYIYTQSYASDSVTFSIETSLISISPDRRYSDPRARPWNGIDSPRWSFSLRRGRNSAPNCVPFRYGARVHTHTQYISDI